MSYGFGDGKNKANVYTTDESDLALAAKQDKHSTQVIELLVADWSNNEQTINVTGVTESNTVLVSPAPESVSDYGNFGIICTAQGTGTLTFTCGITPLNNISVNVIILGV